MNDRVAKTAISARIHPDNYRWLREQAAKQERSANWLLDKMLTEARQAAQDCGVSENARQQ